MRVGLEALIVVAVLTPGVVLAADPPATMNYQAVLRDAAGIPRTGTFDMVFRFLDAQTSGTEILINPHTAAWGTAVAVTNGLFNVHLGEPPVADGSGAGTYTSLAEVFRDYTDVWMEITIGVETLTPRVKLQASAYALNCGGLQGKPASSFLDTSSTPQTKSGPLSVVSASDAITGANSYTGATGALGGVGALRLEEVGVVGYGGPVGAFFGNTSVSQTWIANQAEGMRAIGQTTGGSFANFSGSGGAILASGNTGIAAYGTYPYAAGHFEDIGENGRADFAIGDTGVAASGGYAGGEFRADFGGYFARLASFLWQSAGYFEAPGASVRTHLADCYVSSCETGIWSNGTEAFVQNHPTNPRRLIAYNALEGPEVGTYTRGSGSIRGGEARVALDSTFALTTDPEIGLTAVVTARRPGADLYVASVSTSELVVRSGSGSADDAAFDYVVNGLRVGFENRPVILPSDAFSSATVPSLEAAEARLTALPEDSRASTPFARLTADDARSGSEAPELAGARALIAGINSPEHTQHARSMGAEPISSVESNRARSAVEPSSPAPWASEEPRYILSMPVAMEVQAGAVLSYDPTVPGGLRLAEEVGDPAVVGVVAGPAGSPFRGQVPIALAGTIVPCKVDASYRPIAVGDLLAASASPGMAMSAGANPRRGSVIGRALEPLPAGTGSIRILVMSR